MKIEQLKDGRIAVTLRGDVSGFYVWTIADALRIRDLLDELGFDPPRAEEPALVDEASP